MQPTPSLVIVTHSWAIITWNKILWRCQVKFNSHHVRTEWIFGKTPIQRKSNQSQVVARGKHGIPDTRYWFYRDHPEPVVGGNSHCSWMVWGAVKSKSFSKPFIYKYDKETVTCLLSHWSMPKLFLLYTTEDVKSTLDITPEFSGTLPEGPCSK